MKILRPLGIGFLIFLIGCTPKPDPEAEAREAARVFLNALCALDMETVTTMAGSAECLELWNAKSLRYAIPRDSTWYSIQNCLPDPNGFRLRLMVGKGDEKNEDHLTIKKTNKKWEVNCAFTQFKGKLGIVASIHPEIASPHLRPDYMRPEIIAEIFLKALSVADSSTAISLATPISLDELRAYFRHPFLKGKSLTVLGQKATDENASITWSAGFSEPEAFLNLIHIDSTWRVEFGPKTASGKDKSTMEIKEDAELIETGLWICPKKCVKANHPGNCPGCGQEMIKEKILKE